MFVKIDYVTLGKLSGTLSPLSVLLLAPYFFSEQKVGVIFEILAFGNIIFALVNFGNNGKISFFYKSTTHKSLFLYSYLTTRLVLTALAVWIVSSFIDINGTLLLLCILPLVFNYLEFLSECFDQVELEKYAKTKLMCFAFLFVFKTVLIILDSYKALIILINIEWLILFVLVRKKLLQIGNSAETYPFRKWIADSFYVYWSYFFQMVTTRYLYLDYSSEGKSSFYILLRVVEAFNFIPNAYAAKFFSAYHNSTDKFAHLCSYLKSSVNISIATSIITAVSIFIYFHILSYKIDVYFILVLLCSYFFFKRTSLSRYIVVKNLVYTSPISYVFAFAVTWSCSNYLDDPSILYCVYLVTIYLTLPIFFYNKFYDYLNHSYAFKN